MSAPWLKFYPSDWRADPALRMCSIGARGLWMEMLCLMHEAEPYGSLRINGKEVSPRQLAALAGASIDDVSGWLAEMEEAGVFSRDDAGVITSRRMIRDKAKAETDKANGKRGGNPKVTNGVNPPVNRGDKAQKPEARDHSSDANASGSASPADPRDVLWSEGVLTLKAITGKTESASRQMVGKWLKDAKDDCALVLGKIRTAKAERIGDPVSWITAALKPPDKPPAPARNAGVLAQRQLKAMNDASRSETGYLDQSDAGADFAGPSLPGWLAIASG